jgi:hypothetical protein
MRQRGHARRRAALALAPALLIVATSAATAQETRAAPTALVAPGLSDDLTVWPNRVSYRNSDDWLWQNHDRIRKMRPRVFVLNFANDADMEAIRRHAEGVARATAEATRYHGYEDPAAPAFIEYEIARVVDLRDASSPRAGQRQTSTRFPRKPHRKPDEVLCDYAAFFADDFAEHWGVRDPRDAGRWVNLRALIEGGFAHELWFYAIHDSGDAWPGCETLELKQFYDEQCRPIAGQHGHAGNGRDDTLPWVGRSFRVCFFNPHRGVGCAMENFGHTLEWIANSSSIAYYRKYFYEYAELDLDERYGTPFDELYRTDPQVADSVSYPTPTSMVVKIADETRTIAPYIAFGGNVHFPPGGRQHYDKASPVTVKSTIETYRRGPMDLESRRARARDFNVKLVERVGDVAPDCMGNWTVFWRQCMPGLDNPCLDDAGRPMKNWWVFLFY